MLIKKIRLELMKLRLIRQLLLFSRRVTSHVTQISSEKHTQLEEKTSQGILVHPLTI